MAQERNSTQQQISSLQIDRKKLAAELVSRETEFIEGQRLVSGLRETGATFFAQLFKTGGSSQGLAHPERHWDNSHEEDPQEDTQSYDPTQVLSSLHTHSKDDNLPASLVTLASQTSPPSSVIGASQHEDVEDNLVIVGQKMGEILTSYLSSVLKL